MSGVTRACKPNEFKCRSEPQTCLPNAMVCDGIDDCIDHSDEENCRNRSKKDSPATTTKPPARFTGLLPISTVSIIH